MKDVLSFETSQEEVALHFYQCVQDEKLLCGPPRKVEETKIFGCQAFCSIICTKPSERAGVLAGQGFEF